LSATEPIAALALRFEAEMDLPLVAAESGVVSPDLLKALEQYPYLAKQLGPLRVEGGTVQRQVFIDSFQEPSPPKMPSGMPPDRMPSRHLNWEWQPSWERNEQCPGSPTTISRRSSST
jgi:hypothetical protein